MNPWRGLSGLPREVWFLFAATLVNRVGTMVLPFLAIYVTDGLGLGLERAGAVIAIYGAGAIVAAPLSGRLCDRAGALRVMQGSLVLSGAILLLLPLARSFAAFAAAVLVWSLANEALRPASLAAVGGLVPPESRKAAYALNRLAVNLGMSVGPVVGGLLAHVSFVALFAVDGVTSMIAGCVLLLAPWGAPADTIAVGGSEPSSMFGAAKDRRLLLVCAASILVGLVFFQHVAAMPLFLVRDLGFDASLYGALFSVNTVLIVALEVPLNSATGAWPHRRTLALGALLCAVGFGALAVARTLAGVAASVVVWTFGEMTLFPALSAYVADLAAPERRGQYMGLYTMAFNGSFAVGPWLGTWALDRFGPEVMWSAAFAVGAAAAAMLALAPDARVPDSVNTAPPTQPPA